jgi:uncharacterized OB-fold protein
MDGLVLDGGMTPRLRGQKCAACSNIAFPPNPYGCEICGAGASQLADFPLEGRGRLRAFATTQVAHRKDVTAPFTVASITLEGGPVIRALMTGATDQTLKIGDAVRAVVVKDAGEGAARQLRFELGGNS